MKILCSGSAGYIGSVLCKMLLEQGHEVICFDTFWFGMDGVMEYRGHPEFMRVKADIRTFDPEILKGIDCVMDLASISNDAAGELYPEMTMDINWKGRLRMATLAKRMGVPRYILASSCSLYGANDEIVDETSKLNPLSTYAKASQYAERDILPLADEDFCVTVLRQANVYGLSKKMRFDLAINGMTLGLFKTGKLNILRDGSQWRPFVHVKDTSRAFIMVMGAEARRMNGQVLNVGSDLQNYQIVKLADEVCSALGFHDADLAWYGEPDNRNYRVHFTKIRESLGFLPKFTPAHGAREVMQALKNKEIDPDDKRFYTADWYKTLDLKPVELKQY